MKNDSSNALCETVNKEKSWRDLVINAIFPPRCAGQQHGCELWSRALFCAACAKTLLPISSPFCMVCGAPFDAQLQSAELCAQCRANRYHAAPPFEASRSLYVFDGAIRQAIHRLKYEGKTALAAPLSHLMRDYLTTSSTRFVETSVLTHIVAVPLHARRQRSRGFNQSELLARELAKRIDVPHQQILRRTRPTTPQVELSLRERATNVQGAFALQPNVNIDGARILLIDDVHTTGATLKECAQVLKAGGAAKVFCLTLAWAL